ncbi:MAG TPA: hypothetical protein P5294_11105 [Smithellaceae bacterium]|nr:hypothetical protein [Smithellaceae bacterium]HRS90254.1 hypothetical protein [Smithellaceae bacterium]HRV27077.1 hypothetical protein [Smithellaceae bacterium]
MSKQIQGQLYVQLIGNPQPEKLEMLKILDLLEIKYDSLGVDVSTLPFAPGDTTAGSEAELQTIVKGKISDVDLPQTITESNYYANTRKRTRAGDAPKKTLDKLDDYLQKNSEGIWENSWVRIPLNVLSPYARSIFEGDLLLDKTQPEKGKRSDSENFFCQYKGEKFIRVPISYLLKLSLAEIIGYPHFDHSLVRESGIKIIQHYLNDNTSPEISSFYVSTLPSGEGIGKNAAQEMATRFLLTQLLVMYANRKFMLAENGQEAMIYYSPHPPVRQRILSESISDAFYRELFMNPCLSGWSRGQDKYEYMHLCHRVLSRSQFNAVLKLREAGIITNNLVALPNLSNISLANNGTHVSLGSIKLTNLLQDSASGYSKYHEKYLGDLVVKIAEHFLPLFVGTYSAAPYRMGFKDFHPEKALGFLPHELDFTHLRMFWRRWKKKANLKILGNSVTPFGLDWLDNMISSLFLLKGDFVSDFRLIDYLVALLSTDRSPALNGRLNNSQQLKQDLENMGVFDRKMSLYLFEKLREYEIMGFSGFEGRHYSLFCSFEQDMKNAINMQNLIYLLAFKYIASGEVKHENIPDDPFIESERRQVIFGTAIGIPTFFVHKNTGNEFIRRIVQKTQKIRSSRRYPGYVRVYNIEYRKALLKVIKEDAAELIEMMNMKETINDLSLRIEAPEIYSVAGKLTKSILGEVHARDAMSLKADKFNETAEKYYRETLRREHIAEAYKLFKEQISSLSGNAAAKREINKIMRNYGEIDAFLNAFEKDVLGENVSTEKLERMISLMLVYIDQASALNQKYKQARLRDHINEASVH